MSDIRTWLEAHNLGQYAEAFETNEIDRALLPDLTEADLEKLGIAVMGHRKRLLKAAAHIAETPAEEAVPPAPSPSPPGPARAEAERRQITVMFCDLVGSTALSERLDPEDLRALMQAFQKAAGAVIGQYDGHVAQYLGDGLMVYFGWPRAHEDDAERAVRAGLAIVAAVKRVAAPNPLQVRVGISTGPVVVGDTGAGDASVPSTAVGETPNLAARVQGLADPDCVLLSEATHRLVRGVFEFDALGPRALKGIAGPVEIFRACQERLVENRFEASRETGLTPLVGRASELGLLLDRWRQAAEGEGQTVLLSGEPGIGKSRIVQVLREQLATEPNNVLISQCSPYHTNTAFYPVAEQMARLAGFAREDDAAAKLDKLDRHFTEMGMEVARVVPLFAAALSIPTGDRYPPLDITPQEQKQRTIEALTERVIAVSQRAPVLFVVEDLHWADPTSNETLGKIIEASQSARVMVLGTYRPEFEPPWGGSGHVTALTLNRMGRHQAAALVAEVSGGKQLPDQVLDEIVAKTDGVPLFVEELTKTVLETGLMRDAGDHFVLNGPLPPLAIPSTLRDSLMARLDRMAPVKEVAQIGACIGREFSHRLLAAVSRRAPAVLQDALDQLAGSELIFRQGTPPDAVYTFKHALVRDAAYDSLLKSERQTLHLAIATSLETDRAETAASEPDLLALHFTEAGLGARALPYWRAAGQRAAERFAHAEAASHYTQAVAGLIDLPDRADRVDEEIDLRLSLIASLRILDRYDDALRHLEQVQALATEHNRHAALARVHYLRGNIYFPLGNLDGCLAEHETSYRIARDAGLAEEEARALGGIGDAHYMRGRYRKANAHFDRCLAVCQSEGFPKIETAYLPMRATTNMYDFKVKEALTDCASVVEKAAKFGQLRAELISRNISTQIQCELGQFDQAEESARRAMDLVGRIGAHRFEPMFLDVFARVQIHAGDRAGALAKQEEALRIARDTGIAFLGPWVLGTIAMTTADPDRRRAALREGQALLDAGCVSHNYFWFHRCAIEAALDDRAWQDAARHADALQRYFEDDILAWPDFVAERGRALAAFGQGARSPDLVAQLRNLRETAAHHGMIEPLERLDAALAIATAA